MDGRTPLAGLPFFDGGAMLVVVMATAAWGPLRICEIDQLRGYYEIGSPTVSAIKRLVRLKVCTRTVHNRRNVTVELDRRHPAAHEIRHFALKLYYEFMAPHVSSMPKRSRNQIRYNQPDTPKYEPRSLDLHILGKRARIRVLHSLAEARDQPVGALVRLLGISRAANTEIRRLESIGILKTRSKGVDLYVSLNPSWGPAPQLRRLLKTLNAHLPEYSAIATVHRARRKKGLYKWAVRLRLARRRRLLSGDFAVRRTT
jgi:hypothetical protein